MKTIIEASETSAQAAADVYFKAMLGYSALACELPSGGKQEEFDRVYPKKDASGKVVEVVVVECWPRGRVATKPARRYRWRRCWPRRLWCTAWR